MTGRLPDPTTLEFPEPARSLAVTRSVAEISGEIKATWAKAKADQLEAIHGYIRVGRLLGEARAAFRSNRAYGEWFAAQQFGFSTTWGAVLRRFADNEEAVLAVSETAVSNDEAVPGINRLLEMLRSERDPDENAEREFARALARLEAWREEHVSSPRIVVPTTIEQAVARLRELTDADLRYLILTNDLVLAAARVAPDPHQASVAIGHAMGVMHLAWRSFDEMYDGGLGARLAEIWQRGEERLDAHEPLERVLAWSERAARATVDAWQTTYLQ